jgi:hypothetical protein
MMSQSLDWKEGILQGLLLAVYQAIVRKDNVIFAIDEKPYPYWAVSGFAGFFAGVVGGMLHNMILPRSSKSKDQKYTQGNSALLSVIIHSLAYIAFIVGVSSYSYIQVIGPTRLAAEGVGSNLIANYLLNFMGGKGNVFY